MTRARAACAAFSASLLAGSFAAAGDSTRLVFVRDASAATSCPDEETLRRAVEARLGRDPFLPWGDATIVVRLTQDARGFVAAVELVTRSDSRGLRTLRSEDGGCAGLIDAAALAVSIALDAMPAAARSTATSPPTEAPPRYTRPPADEAMPAPRIIETSPPGRRGLRPVVGVDLLASAGSAPAVAAGLAAWVRLEGERWSLAVEARADLPSAASEPPLGSVTAWLVAGGFVPCLRVTPLLLCAVGELGRVDAGGANVAHPMSGSALFAAIGPRVALELALSDRFALRLRADVLADVAPASVTLGGAKAWTAPTLTGSLGAGLAVRFP